jgi:hypothetical protein
MRINGKWNEWIDDDIHRGESLRVFEFDCLFLLCGAGELVYPAQEEKTLDKTK